MIVPVRVRFGLFNSDHSFRVNRTKTIFLFLPRCVIMTEVFYWLLSKTYELAQLPLLQHYQDHRKRKCTVLVPSPPSIVIASDDDDHEVGYAYYFWKTKARSW
jgi:hypothetical protein